MGNNQKLGTTATLQLLGLCQTVMLYKKFFKYEIPGLNAPYWQSGMVKGPGPTTSWAKVPEMATNRPFVNNNFAPAGVHSD